MVLPPSKHAAYRLVRSNTKLEEAMAMGALLRILSDCAGARYQGLSQYQISGILYYAGSETEGMEIAIVSALTCAPVGAVSDGLLALPVPNL